MTKKCFAGAIVFIASFSAATAAYIVYLICESLQVIMAKLKFGAEFYTTTYVTLNGIRIGSINYTKEGYYICNKLPGLRARFDKIHKTKQGALAHYENSVNCVLARYNEQEETK